MVAISAKSHFLHLVMLTFLLSLPASRGEGEQQQRPNVLFMIVDDLNDMPLHPDGKPFVATPNFDRLAARGMSFTNAHCNDPICAPSRSSMLTGLYPQTSSLYWFEDYRQNAILSQSVTLPEHLAGNGYDVFSVGKIFHGNQDPKPVYKEMGPGGNIGPWPWDGSQKNRRGFIPHPQQIYFYGDDADPDMDYKWEHTFGPLSRIPHYPEDPSSGAAGYRGWTLSGKPFHYNGDNDRDPMPDEINARWATSILQRKHNKPFFLFTGFSRTHTPLYAPKEYFDRFPIEKIEIPKGMLEGDLKDCAPSLANQSLYAFRRYQMLFKHKDHPDLFKEWLQAYMACVAFIDDQVGTVLDALEQSDYADNTIVILTSDHGFHVGGKQALYKQTLWDSGTRIPFIVAGLQGMPEGVTCQQPISLIDVYPTLIDLCQLPKNPNHGSDLKSDGYDLDGHSIKPLLDNPQGQWGGPNVVITALPGKDHSQHRVHTGTLYPHFSVRSKDWRYSLTSDGQEELYHYPSDPFEFKNLAEKDEHTTTKQELKAELIRLRDGSDWEPLSDQQFAQKYDGFEWVASVKGTLRFQFGEHTLAEINTKSRTNEPSHVRIRAAGKRCQVWVNHRVHSDEVFEKRLESGQLRVSLLTKASELTSARIKPLRLRKTNSKPLD